MLIAVEITLRISGFQLSASKLQHPDYLMYSAIPEHILQRVITIFNNSKNNYKLFK